MRFAELKWRLFGYLGALLVRLLMCTVRVSHVPRHRGRYCANRAKRRPVIYAFWHCMLLVPAYTHRGRAVHVLISRHRDGEYIARVIEALGNGTVRGSSTRGGSRALMGLVRKTEEGYDVAFTPDGPRGPRHVVQPGVIYLAQKTGLPIVTGGMAVADCWELPSWDRFCIPKPFSRAIIIYSPPLTVEPDLNEHEFEERRAGLERLMRRMDDDAKRAVRREPAGPPDDGDRSRFGDTRRSVSGTSHLTDRS